MGLFSLLLLSSCVSPLFVTRSDLLRKRDHQISTSNLYGQSPGAKGWFDLSRQEITDLAFLKGQEVNSLTLYQTPIFDLSPLKCLGVKRLAINRTLVTDLTPLKGRQLEELYLDVQFTTSGLQLLRKMKSLRLINGIPVDEFWKTYDEGKGSRRTFTDKKYMHREYVETQSIDALMVLMWQRIEDGRYRPN